MDQEMLSVPVPDVVGLSDEEAKRILEQHGFVVKSVEITKSFKDGQPEGGCRVVRQHASGQDVQLMLAFQKWVCS
ncbi:hypothetical protein DCMF_06865 [Candidatus Formimonas warabiya]|uniref:PASTA domain-containing protein n=2 Tax=Formimonas warabiya TaxID=1761012 RepID=A0A3G1KPY6_FORW1|nr:hypothetical protein DCMF_06865 [Candidatus Formimonas warabiya]